MDKDLQYKIILNAYSKIANGDSKDFASLSTELGRYIETYLDSGNTKYSKELKLMMSSMTDKKMSIILDELLLANLSGEKKDYAILNKMHSLLERSSTTYIDIFSVFGNALEPIPQADNRLSAQFRIYVYDHILSSELMLYQKYTLTGNKKLAEFLYQNEKLVGEGKKVNWTEEVISFLGRREKQNISDLGDNSFIVLKSIALSFKAYSYFNVMPAEKVKFLSLLKDDDQESFDEMIDIIKRILGEFLDKTPFERHVFSHMVFANMKIGMLDENLKLGKSLQPKSPTNLANGGERSFKRPTDADKDLIKLRARCVNRFLAILSSVNRDFNIRGEIIRTIYSCNDIDKIMKFINAIENKTLSVIHDLENKSMERKQF